MIFSSKLSIRTMVPFCRQLATAHGAGIPILRSLEIITRQTRDGRLRNVVSRMAESVRRGSTLEQAARFESTYLPSFFVELVGAGEMGGRLEEMFENLAGYYERTLNLVRQIRGSLIYPVAQLLMLWLVANFIVSLGDFMAEGSRSLDEILRVFVQQLGYQTLIGLVALVVAIVLARAGLLKWVVGLVTTFIRPFAPVARKIAMARFTRSLSLLLRSGVPIAEATRKSAATTNNPYIERSLLNCVPAIESGESVSTALSPCRYLSDMAREMIYTGEESGKLDYHLSKVADIHEAEAMQAVRNLIRVAQIVVLLMIGGVIGVFVIKFYLGYFGALFRELDM